MKLHIGRLTKTVSSIVLFCYILFVYSRTVLFRKTATGHIYNFQPLWSYEAIANGRESLILEHILNILLFMPIGFMAGVVFESKRWWKVILLGLGISVSIEAMQYYFKKGFAELDDVMHNTIGCLLGFLLFLVVNKIVNKSFKK